MTKEPEKDIGMKQLIRVKGHGVLSRRKYYHGTRDGYTSF